MLSGLRRSASGGRLDSLRRGSPGAAAASQPGAMTGGGVGSAGISGLRLG